MDLFNRRNTDAQQAEIDDLRSQINIARATLHHRLDRQFSQAYLGSLAHTTQARVSEIEGMKGDPRLSTLGRVALALGCMIDMVPILAASASSMPPAYTTVSSVDARFVANGSASHHLPAPPFAAKQSIRVEKNG